MDRRVIVHRRRRYSATLPSPIRSVIQANKFQTVSALSCFFLAMTLYPDVQRKAQEELDRVLGPNRLPTFEDRDNLPYIEALVKETLRWHPVAPTGIPHLCTEDDLYNGYLIPKGALILPNIW